MGKGKPARAAAAILAAAAGTGYASGGTVNSYAQNSQQTVRMKVHQPAEA